MGRKRLDWHLVRRDLHVCRHRLPRLYLLPWLGKHLTWQRSELLVSPRYHRRRAVDGLHHVDCTRHSVSDVGFVAGDDEKCEVREPGEDPVRDATSSKGDWNTYSARVTKATIALPIPITRSSSFLSSSVTLVES